MIFLSAGRKSHDTMIKISHNNGGNISFAEPNTIGENTAPNMSLSTCYLLVIFCGRTLSATAHIEKINWHNNSFSLHL